MLKKIIGVLIVLAMAVLYVYSRIEVVEMGYQVSRLKSRVTEMERTNSLLKSKAAGARATIKLDVWSRELGMALPEQSQILLVGE